MILIPVVDSKKCGMISKKLGKNLPLQSGGGFYILGIIPILIPMCELNPFTTLASNNMILVSSCAQAEKTAHSDRVKHK